MTQQEKAPQDDASCYDYQPVAHIWENRVWGGKLLRVSDRTLSPSSVSLGQV